jgi:hypothetical protein
VIESIWDVQETSKRQEPFGPSLFRQKEDCSADNTTIPPPRCRCRIEEHFTPRWRSGTNASAFGFTLKGANMWLVCQIHYTP